MCETQYVLQDTLNRFLELKGMTGKELAERIGASEGAVSNWRNGKNSINIEFIPGICKSLDITPSEFFNYDSSFYLSREEHELLQSYRDLGDGGKRIIEDVLTSLAQHYPSDR